MKRISLLVLTFMIVFPAIGQEINRTRNCRPLLSEIDLSKHAARRASALTGTYRATGNNPYIGDRHQLVVLAEFKDQTFKGDSAQTMSQWGRILNTRYLSEDSFYGSVHDYFYDQSYGQFDLSFDLYYAVVDSMAKYRSTITSDENSKYLVRDVLNVIGGKVSDWAPYDWDGDGYVDQLLIIYAGKGQSDGGGSNTIWPHQWWLSEYNSGSAITVSSGGKDYLIDSHCCVQELDGRGTYGSFGTLCHEFSHCLGLPDFYEGSTKYVGSWDLMDNGLYNGNGFRPCGYSAFERAFMGWLTPVELNSSQTVMGLPSLITQPVAYIIRNEGKADEYYMVENRQKAGWDEKLPGSGIVVFHVDYDETVFKYGQPNTSNGQHYLIIPANNKPTVSGTNQSGWAYPNNGNNSLTNTSTPAAELFNLNKDSTLLMNKPMTEMAVIKGMAQFKFQNTFTGIAPVEAAPSNDGGWFTIDGRQLLEAPSGKGLYIHEGRVILIR